MRIREARESDARSVRDVMFGVYGEHYTYPAFYDIEMLRRMILGPDTLMLVAEAGDGHVVGTASVILEVGAYADLVGEFGRLAVLAEARGRGVGSSLMEERLARVRSGLHVGIVEARVAIEYSMRISQHYGFVPVGFCPRKSFFRERESNTLLIQWFGGSLALRRNNPRIIAEIHPIAGLALDNAGLPVDVVVDDTAPPYPHDRDFTLERLSTAGYASLLRIERGRTRHREVFGPMRLHYGFFKLAANDAHYLLARRGDRIAGAVGYTHDEHERLVRIFELITPDDQAIAFLLGELERRCREQLDVAYIEVDVNAHAPRMQRTLLELGFLPTGYLPALAFHEVERLDVVRMARVLTPIGSEPMSLTPEVARMADLVVQPFSNQQRVERLDPVIRGTGLLEGLTDEQAARLAAICEPEAFGAGDTIIQEAAPGDALHLILSGAAEIRVGPGGRPVGRVGPGEALGELGLLEHVPHGATAVAAGNVKAARAGYDALATLVRRRPDIGVIIFRNLARGLGEKLRRADETPSSGRDGTERPRD